MSTVKYEYCVTQIKFVQDFANLKVIIINNFMEALTEKYGNYLSKYQIKRTQ